MFRDRTFEICLGLALILASPTFLPINTWAAAQDHSKSDVTETTKVVAHIPLPGSAVRQIFSKRKMAGGTFICSRMFISPLSM